MGAAAQKLDQGRISFERTNESTLVTHLSSPWHLQRDLPPTSLLTAELGRPSDGSRTRPLRLRTGTAD
jgi:hypothetical protein